MRIGIYDPYLDDLGGGEKYMMTIAECLSKTHDVTVFWNNKSDLERIAARFALDLSQVKIETNIFSKNISIMSRLSATKRFDALIILTDGSIPLVLSKRLYVHIQQPLRIANLKSVKNKFKLGRIEKYFYNSKFTKEFSYTGDSSVASKVIYPPVTSIVRKTVKENLIIHVGRFRVLENNDDDFKKQNLMIKVFIEMIEKGLKNWKFVIATSTNDLSDPKFKSMMENVKGYPIEFLINKNNSDLWDVYNKAKIYWHASGFGENLKLHPEYAEHFGISTVEAMSVGVVPVVINAGGQKEIVNDGENGLLWNDLNALKHQTQKLIDDKDLWTRLSETARQDAGKYSKEKFCQNINDLIKA